MEGEKVNGIKIEKKGYNPDRESVIVEEKYLKLAEDLANKIKESLPSLFKNFHGKWFFDSKGKLQLVRGWLYLHTEVNKFKLVIDINGCDLKVLHEKRDISDELIKHTNQRELFQEEFLPEITRFTKGAVICLLTKSTQILQKHKDSLVVRK